MWPCGQAAEQGPPEQWPAWRRRPGSIGAGGVRYFAIGNAPQPDPPIYELVEGGTGRPRPCHQVPVGFVNVVQSKELILTLEDTPYIVAREEKAAAMLPPPSVMPPLYQIRCRACRMYYTLFCFFRSSSRCRACRGRFRWTLPGHPACGNAGW